MQGEFLNLFFNEGEKFSISHNDYGYQSITREEYDSGIIKQISPNEKIQDELVSTQDLVLMALNPIDGYRRDENVTAYRSFLIEMDDGTLEEQMKYIEDSGLPYSCCVFSGNKSLHFGVVLDHDLPSYQVWRDVAEWILAILDKADPMTKNPTRCIRFPGNKRPNGKQLEQKLLKIKGRVSNDDLSVWLNKHPDKNPALLRKSRVYNTDINPYKDGAKIPKSVINKLEEGIGNFGPRNTGWFNSALILAKKGFSEDDILDYLEQYFEEESDFKKNEWETAVKSGYKIGSKDIL